LFTARVEVVIPPYSESRDYSHSFLLGTCFGHSSQSYISTFIEDMNRNGLLNLPLSKQYLEVFAGKQTHHLPLPRTYCLLYGTDNNKV
jgi:hypothetical protein